MKIKDDANNPLETYTYGADRNRLINDTGSQKTYYAWGGSSVIQEYTEATGSTSPIYSKCYIYAGSRLLSTATNIGGSELVEFHHPDRLGTKLVTTPSANTSNEQATLPFGTELAGEEVGTGTTNQKFTSYDRSSSTGLDYAVNRTYSPGQGRFTQVDPLGIKATSKENPQSLNLFVYVRNNPIDSVDPSGLNMVECHWWHWVYDSGPDKGKEVPNSGGAHLDCHEVAGGGSPGSTGGASPGDTGGGGGGHPSMGASTGLPPHQPVTPPNPCGAVGGSLSVFAGAALFGHEYAGTGGIVGGVDSNPYNVTTFHAPYGGIVFGGSGNGGGTGSPSREGWGFGMAASAGPSLFLSNEDRPRAQEGVFNTTFVAIPVAPPVSFVISRDRSPDGSVTNYGIGTGIGAGIFNFDTNTLRPQETMTNLPGGCAQNVQLM